MNKQKAFLATKILYTLGAAKLLDLYAGSPRLTVLTYHSIADVNDPDFDLYEPNVSASPAMFEQQIAYAAKNFDVVDLQAVVAFVTENKPLPKRPLLITFDDGYLNNYQLAYPILKKYGLPAVIFLMTHWMSHTYERPWWDECAYQFNRTPKTSAELPFVGTVDLPTRESRIAIRDKIMAELKKVPNAEKQVKIQEMRQALEIPDEPHPHPIFMNWEQVRELVDNRVACQPHTVNHPILTRISDEQIEEEIRLSRQHILQETPQTITAFAYPNGRVTDYNQAALNALRKYEYKVAFTLSPGPVLLEEARRHPLEIRRIYLGWRDTFEGFVMKVMGASAIGDKITYLA